VGAETAFRAPAAFHPEAMRLSSARAALALVLDHLRPRRVFLPDWVCDTVLEPVRASGTTAIRLEVGPSLLPVRIPTPEYDELLLLVDPFGLGRPAVEARAPLGQRLLVDATQALYQPPPAGCWGIASARKFLGVPDGAFVWGPVPLSPPSRSNTRVTGTHLLARAAGAPEALSHYRTNEAALSTDLLAPAPLSDALLDRIDHDEVKRRRSANAAVLHARLKAHNQLVLPDPLPADAVPMAYPFLPARAVPHTALYAEQIWVPRLWPERQEDGLPYTRHLSQHLLPLPCDQRYDAVHMHHIADVLLAAMAGSGRR